MSTAWLKIAGIVVILVVVVVIGANLISSKKPPRQEQPPQTLEQVWENDQQRLNAPITPQPQPNEVNTTAGPQLQPVFRQLTVEQQVRAEELWQMVITSRKMGRLPVIPYGQMVQYCRQIITEFPGSEYAYRAKQALAELPDSVKRQYNITQTELDLSEFYKQR